MMQKIVKTKDVEKSLKSKCLTRTYEKTSYTTYTLNIKITSSMPYLPYNLYN